MLRNRTPLVLALAASLLISAGCWRSSGYQREVKETEPFVLGDLVEPFDPPSLEELEQNVTWVDMPVLDSMQLLRERQAGEEVNTSVEEALRMRNDSPEANEKILNALGRLPESETAVDWNSSIVRHASADVRSTNPVLASSVIEFDVSGLTGLGLIGFDWNFRPYAAKDVVKTWQASEDKLYDKIVLRDDLTWSDGTPVTAHDVVFSYQLIMSSAVPIPAQRSGTDKLRWVEAYDDHTLVFFHREPLATNVWNIGFSIIPKHIYERSVAEDPTLADSDYHVKYEKNPVSGGPYIIKERTLGREIVLERREDWHTVNGQQVRDKPHFKEIRFRVLTEPSVALLALKAGDLEEKQLLAEEWQTKTNDDDFYKNNTKAYDVEWVYFYFGWNNDTPYFSDKRVRQAMSYAFDHEELLNKLLYGLYEPSTGIFHPTSRWSPQPPPEPYSRDIAKAEQLLDDAGWIDHDGDGIRDKEINGRTVPFQFSILVVNAPDRIAICNLLKQNLSDIGVLCEVRPMEFTVLQEKTQKHEFHAVFGGWGTGADPDTAENIWGTGEDRNFVNYANPKVDELFEQGRRELDPEERAEIYRQIHQILYEDQPYTWLYYRNAFYGFNKKLRGYNFSPRGPYNYGPGFSSIWKPAVD